MDVFNSSNDMINLQQFLRMFIACACSWLKVMDLQQKWILSEGKVVAVLYRTLLLKSD
jgi:hypothetical protein